MASGLYRKCLEAVKTTIDGLSLTHADSRAVTVTVRKRPYNQDKWERDITLSHSRMTTGIGTNQDEDVGYGIRVTIVGASSGGSSEDQDSFTYWEELIRNAFWGKRLSGVTEVWYCGYEPAQPLADAPYTKDSRDVSEFIIRCWTRELVRS